MTEAERPTASRLRRVRLLLWLLVALAALGTAALLLIRRGDAGPPPVRTTTVNASFGGPFALVGADGNAFSSNALAGKPYAIFFGFTRCGDVCPTTLGRLARLRDRAGGDGAFHIVFVTIDPEHDGPKEVGQYATMFDAPIIGLTGSPEQIRQVKKQYGIHAEPAAHAQPGQEMVHTDAVLLFDESGRLAGTISSREPDESALRKLRQLAG